GQHKGLALRERVASIHPGCEVLVVDAFAGPDNWPALLPRPVDAVIDACDQVRSKVAIAAWALQARVVLISVGAAGGKKEAQRVEVVDLAETTHDPLLASLRQRLRKESGAAGIGRPIGVRCVFSRESVHVPVARTDCQLDGSLNCHGYGSSVAVTAAFGMVAAGEVMQQLTAGDQARPAPAEPPKHADIM
ncbi:MAG TPA: ThiF family adenylyltransferase, partial [Rubrivivax sp.]|nr:ThiF family adenylyltransferase [Rubrivivax sp.]